MQVITPKQSVASKTRSSKPMKKGTLEPVKFTPSSSTSSTLGFPRGLTLDSSEKQKLKLLAGNPMKLDELYASLKAKEQHFDEEARKKEERLQRLQESISALMSRKTEDGSPLVDLKEYEESNRSEPAPEELSDEESLEWSQESSTLLQSIDSAMSERAASRERIAAETEAMLQRVDEDGNKLIELPQNYDDILNMVYEMQSISRDSDPPENCIEVYEKTQAIIGQNERNQEEWRKIRELDRVIVVKERELRAIEAKENMTAFSSVSNSTDRPTFVTAYKKSVSKSSVTHPDKVQRNIDTAGNPLARFSMIERLAQKDKDRLLALEAETESPASSYDLEMQKLAAVDEKLKAFVPQEKWEERSIQSYPTNLQSGSETSFNTSRSALTAPTLMLSAEPGEKELQAAKEKREARDRMTAINKSLETIREEPQETLTDFEIQKLLCDAEDTIHDSQSFIATALFQERTSALEVAKELLVKLEGNLKDDAETAALMEAADSAMKKYQTLYEVEQEELMDDPQVVAEQQHVRTLVTAYEAKEREIEEIMSHLDGLEEKLKEQVQALALEDEDINRLPPELQPVPIPEQNIDDFERAIEKRVKSRNYVQSSRSVLTAEEFPLTLQLLEAQEEESKSEKPDLT